MEDDGSYEGYVIKNARIPIILALRPVSSLLAHEETVPDALARLIALIEKDPVLRHPLIVDRSTGLVLDGTHRLAALFQLGCRGAPCALINYEDPRIKVERWFRVVKGSSPEAFKSKLGQVSFEASDPIAAERCIAARKCYGSIESGSFCLVFPSSDSDPMNLAHQVFEIEQIARAMGLTISYSDRKALKPTQRDEFVLSTVKIEKTETLEFSRKHVLFPPKTTRHIIPSRPLGVNIPTEWLRAPPTREAKSRFIEHLRSRKMTRLPEGSWVGSRRYEEEVLIFG